MHNAADHKATHRTAGEMQGWSLLHAEMSDQSSLGKEVSRELDRASKTSSNHGGRNTTVQSSYALGAVNVVQAVPSAAILVLCANGSEFGETLKTSFNEEEGTATSCPDNARGSTTQHIDGHILPVSVLEERGS